MSDMIEQYKKAAEQGDAVAQFKLGLLYATEQDYRKAAEWYCKAAEQGYAKAQYELGAYYEHGQGVPQDYNKAVEWYRKAAEQGHKKAQKGLEDKKLLYYAGGFKDEFRDEFGFDLDDLLANFFGGAKLESTKSDPADSSDNMPKPKAKQCPNCGTLYDEDHNFCFSCGAKLVSAKSNSTDSSGFNPKTKQCPNCRTWYDEDHQFCFSCGAKLVAATVHNNQSVSSVPPTPAPAAMSPTMQCPKCRLLFKNKEKCPVCGSKLVVKS